MTDDEIRSLLDATTPGPWVADGFFMEGERETRIAMPDKFGVPMASIGEAYENWDDGEGDGVRRISWKEAEANARLMAAAPALANAALEARAELETVKEKRDYWLEEMARCIMACPPGYRGHPLSDGIKRLRNRLAVVERERDALAAVKPRRSFPILKGEGARIDYQLVADHAEQARKNHYQSVDRLAERGGLSWCELHAVLHNRNWEKMDTNDAMIACRSLEARYLAALALPVDGGAT